MVVIADTRSRTVTAAHQLILWSGILFLRGAAIWLTAVASSVAIYLGPEAFGPSLVASGEASCP